MPTPRHDPALDDLLHLDGQVLVVDPAGGHWVKFVVKRVSPSPDRPHGLSYSLTLHDAAGNRLVGYDNAHPPPGRKRRKPEARDHRHGPRVTRPYRYRSAAELLADFWTDVDSVLTERGVFK
ncbi:MAG: hypothetical protein IT564_11055 [Rhodospirillales bacterium]|nr:hypothetical protein [Rhodospirillales bacterium]